MRASYTANSVHWIDFRYSLKFRGGRPREVILGLWSILKKVTFLVVWNKENMDFIRSIGTLERGKFGLIWSIGSRIKVCKRLWLGDMG